MINIAFRQGRTWVETRDNVTTTLDHMIMHLPGDGELAPIIRGFIDRVRVIATEEEWQRFMKFGDEQMKALIVRMSQFEPN